MKLKFCELKVIQNIMASGFLSSFPENRKLSGSEGKLGRKQLSKHFMPVSVLPHSQQQKRNSQTKAKQLYLHSCRG